MWVLPADILRRLEGQGTPGCPKKAAGGTQPPQVEWIPGSEEVHVGGAASRRALSGQFEQSFHAPLSLTCRGIYDTGTVCLARPFHAHKTPTMSPLSRYPSDFVWGERHQEARGDKALH